MTNELHAPGLRSLVRGSAVTLGSGAWGRFQRRPARASRCARPPSLRFPRASRASISIPRSRTSGIRPKASAAHERWNRQSQKGGPQKPRLQGSCGQVSCHEFESQNQSAPQTQKLPGSRPISFCTELRALSGIKWVCFERRPQHDKCIYIYIYLHIT